MYGHSEAKPDLDSMLPSVVEFLNAAKLYIPRAGEEPFGKLLLRTEIRVTPVVMMISNMEDKTTKGLHRPLLITDVY